MKQLIPLFALLMLIGGCGLIGDKEEEVIDPNLPVELFDIVETAEVDRLWSTPVGKGVGDEYAMLKPALDGDRIYAAGRDGNVAAFSAEGGDRIWRRELDDVRITGGVGASNGLVIVGTHNGEVYALEQSDGSVRWNVTVSSEILASPETNGDLVIISTIDGNVFGLEASTGAVRWRSDVIRPVLSLRGNGAPVVLDGIAYVGHDNGKVGAYRADDGGKIWEARVAIPSGRTELERLVDIDASPLFYAGVLYAVSFQGGLMAINPETGRGFWYQEASSHNDIGAWGGTLAITEVDGTIRTFNVADGTQVWTNTELKNRGLNAPVVNNAFVATVDFEGFLHVLDRQTGNLVGRRKVQNDGVRAPMLIRSNTVYLLDNDGTLSAWEINYQT